MYLLLALTSSFSTAKAKETISINRYCQQHLLIYVMHKQSVGDPGNQVRRFMIIAISFRWSNIRSKGIECVEHKVVTGWSDRFTPLFIHSKLYSMPPTPIKLDTKTLALFSQRLLNCPRYKFGYKEHVRDAAVLMPLCQVNGEASVLFTVRNMNMRTHRGEIRQVKRQGGLQGKPKLMLCMFYWATVFLVARLVSSGGKVYSRGK